MEKKTFIVRCGETALKGDNKPYFERMLVQRIRKAASDIAGLEAERVDGLIFVRTPESASEEETLRRIGRVFGVESISPAEEIDIEGMPAEQAISVIGAAAVEKMLGLIENRGIKTFKIDAKRADKTFAVESPQIAKNIGAMVLKGCKVLKVDVHEPDCRLFVNVRRGKAYIYERKISGFGGLPLGTNGKGMVLLSSGIDSPVAAFMMAHRGMYIDAVHFHSYPYTSERAWEKLLELARRLSLYTGRIHITSVNLLPIQEQIVQNCPEEETTILVRRFMMRIAERIAEQRGCLMLISGESLGQVASQTAEALVVTDDAVKLPVMRPLIAMDKSRIIELAREIGTFDISIQPYEDCCTVFLPRHPVTRPKLEKILQSESLLDCEALISAAVEDAEEHVVSPG
ncbi:MAG TPA: tRNA uracil 4-sulfurtransferase ThiI [Bacillota bacterium]|nr:tRNA uracil 4-sulfurtransferase ThiI [Bacillota bacterium]